MDCRIAALLEVSEARELLALMESEARAKNCLPIAVSGLPRDVLLMLAAEGSRRLAGGGCSLHLVQDAATARRLVGELRAVGLRAAAYLPREYILYHVTASHDEERGRLAALAALAAGELDALVTTPEAALGYTLPRGSLAAAVRTLAVGDAVAPAELCAALVAGGYLRVDTVEAEGQFAHRGGIVDFFSGGDGAPTRIEFFGDEIDRICHFDALTQRNTEPVMRARILPVREVVADGAARRRILAEMEGRLPRLAGEQAREALLRERAAVEAGAELSFADKYIREIYPERETLLSYFEGQRPPVFLFEARSLFSRLSEGMALLLRREGEMMADGLLPAGYASSRSEGELSRFLEGAFCLYLSSFASPPAGQRLSGLFGFSCRTTVAYGDKPELLLGDLTDYCARGYRVILLCRTAAECRERAAALREGGLGIAEEGALLPAPGEVLLAVGGGGGFELPTARIAVLSLDGEGEGRARRARRARYVGRKSGAGDKILSYAELKEGDYVVHAAHGIGRFLGMRSLAVDGVTSDYITLQYAGDEKLFLRADKLDMVARYIGARAEDGSVKLSRIGGTEWGRAKSRAKAAARDMAKELVGLYAARQRLAGFAFPPEGALEAEFADSFEYEETEPQRIAIGEIAADMARPVPMDRLLCGDVGFGKTEVALRAAFRAVVAGKQVAFLVPTTILALQHYTTILSRMRGYPVNVEMLSRFRKPREAAAILRRLARGEIDIIVGTHSLLGKGVSFRDLGLLIVDEEQRFGVGQKERIKQMASGVDVLTLTATPIPRTLNMAMNGIRDMSVLDEAPADRYPVATFVMEHDDLLIEEAIRRELDRGGQVLYLYNRVESIHHVAEKLARALPEARLAVAHGKMEREELEGIWQSLVLGELDILVATTIIETGVDLPNANTLIIEDADRLGLAQLHQLRGRVGRSSRRAYAYCTYRPGKVISEIATKRLEAIREYAEFGAGFRVALRDLEIRGAGNLLGAEQHGHIDSVGYDMYVRLLSEAVLEEKGGAAPAVESATVDLSVDAHIPTDYIETDGHRIDMYKKLSLIATEEDRGDVLDELCDRFGEPPHPVVALLDIALSRAIATRVGIRRIEQRGSDVRFLFPSLSLSAWSEAFAAVPGLRMTGSPPFVTYRLRKGESVEKTVLKVLTAYAAGAESQEKQEVHDGNNKEGL